MGRTEYLPGLGVDMMGVGCRVKSDEEEKICREPRQQWHHDDVMMSIVVGLLIESLH